MSPLSCRPALRGCQHCRGCSVCSMPRVYGFVAPEAGPLLPCLSKYTALPLSIKSGVSHWSIAVPKILNETESHIAQLVAEVHTTMISLLIVHLEVILWCHCNILGISQISILKIIEIWEIPRALLFSSFLPWPVRPWLWEVSGYGSDLTILCYLIFLLLDGCELNSSLSNFHGPICPFFSPSWTLRSGNRANT